MRLLTWVFVNLSSVTGAEIVRMASPVLSLCIAYSTIAIVLSQKVEVWLTTTDSANLLSKKTNVDFVDDTSVGTYVVDVDSSLTFQKMDGFGASLTESSAYLISQKMSESQRTNLLQKLFSRTEGIGLSFLRQPMGSSDFALGNYNYDDTCCNLDDFSIKREKQYIVPLLKRIRTINPDLLIIGCPWSPPGWMKTSGSMIKGSLKTEYYKQLAEYFVKYVQAYNQEGIPIYAVSIQNEPKYEPSGYPGMLMEPNEQLNFVKNNLGPQFRNNSIRSKIIIFEHNWDMTSYPLTILGDSNAANYVDGTAFHCYGGVPEDQSKVHDAHPNKDIWLTECSSGTWMTEHSGNGFEAVFYAIVNDLIIGSVRNWAKSVIKWNLALDENKGPQNGGCNNCFGTVEIKHGTGEVTYNAEYYALGHASKFVRQNAKRIQSTSFSDNGITSVAFENPDGSKVLIAFNTKGGETSFKIRWGRKSFFYSLPPKAAATFTWTGLSTKLSAFQQIEAESYSQKKGTADTEPCSDISGCGYDIGYTGDGDYLVFNNIDFGSGADYVSLRVASAIKSPGNISLRLDNINGIQIASIEIRSTGGWQNWRTQLSSVRAVSGGVHNVVVVFPGGVNLNWFTFLKKSQFQSNYYVITSRKSGKVLDVRDNGMKDGSLLQQWDYFNSNNQKFRFGDAGGSAFKIVIKSSLKVLQVRNNSTSNGASVESWNDLSTANQKWALSDNNNGVFKILSQTSGKSLDVKDRSDTNGAEIQLWDYFESDNQQWTIQSE